MEEQQKLKLLTGTSVNIIPQVSNLNNYYSPEFIKKLSIDSLSKLAMNNRPDFIIATKNIAASEWALKWQKAIAKPDLTLGAAYDQRGGAFNNQTNITFGMPLPIWNKNKGNIKIAEIQLKQSKVMENFIALQLKNEVNTYYQKWLEASINYQYLANSNTESFELVYQGVINNFRKKNITILEFTDFMESYNQSIQNFNEISKTLILSCEDLNKTINQKIF